MARSRMIHPLFFRHAELYQAELAAALPLRLAFAGLWCVADREGRFRWRPVELKLDVLPYDAVDFGAVLTALEAGGFIRRYVVAGKVFGDIPTFLDYQKPHLRESASRVPAYPVTAQGEPKARPRQTFSLPRRPESESESESESEKESETKKMAAAARVPLADLDYVTRCVIALNTGLSENPDLGRTATILPASGQMGAVSWQADGIPIELAEEIIRERSRAYRPTPRHRQPNSLRYFDAAVREAHERQTVTPEDEDARFARLKAKLEAQEAVA